LGRGCRTRKKNTIKWEKKEKQSVGHAEGGVNQEIGEKSRSIRAGGVGADYKSNADL